MTETIETIESKTPSVILREVSAKALSNLNQKIVRMQNNVSAQRSSLAEAATGGSDTDYLNQKVQDIQLAETAKDKVAEEILFALSLNNEPEVQSALLHGVYCRHSEADSNSLFYPLYLWFVDRDTKKQIAPVIKIYKSGAATTDLWAWNK